MRMNGSKEMEATEVEEREKVRIKTRLNGGRGLLATHVSYFRRRPNRGNQYLKDQEQTRRDG